MAHTSAPLAGEIAAAIEHVRRAAELEAQGILDAARREARHVLNVARLELSELVEEILELRRQRDELLARQLEETRRRLLPEVPQRGESVFVADPHLLHRAVRSEHARREPPHTHSAGAPGVGPSEGVSEPVRPVTSGMAAAAPQSPAMTAGPEPTPSETSPPAGSPAAGAQPAPAMEPPIFDRPARPASRQAARWAIVASGATAAALVGFAVLRPGGAADGSAAGAPPLSAVATLGTHAGPERADPSLPARIETPVAAPPVADGNLTGEPAALSGAPSQASGGQTLTVQATRDVWIRPDIDGRRGAGILLKAGRTHEWTAARTITLRVGDAGAVLVSANGEPPAPLGRNGQVLNRTFAAPAAASRPSAADAGAAPAPVAAVAVSAARPAPGAPSPARVTPASPGSPQAGSEGSPAPRAAAAPAPIGALAPAVRPASAPDAAMLPRALPTAPAPAPANTPGAAPIRPDSALPPDQAAASRGDSIRETLLAGDRRWFAAHYAGNPTAVPGVTAPDFDLHDERSDAQRPRVPGAGVDRVLRDVQVHVAGEGAVLSATMIERTAGGGAEYASRLSEVWIRQQGEWRLLGVRIAPQR